MKPIRDRAARNLFNALFCYGEEGEVWFSVEGLARAIGTPPRCILEALPYLREQIYYVFLDNGNCYGRQKEVPTHRLVSVGEALHKQDSKCAVCRTGLASLSTGVEFSANGYGPCERILCSECTKPAQKPVHHRKTLDELKVIAMEAQLA